MAEKAKELVVNGENELEAERNAKYQQKREMPSKASEPKTKLTTGSRIASKRNDGRRIPCHRSQRERARRFLAAGTVAFWNTLGLIASTMFFAAR